MARAKAVDQVVERARPPIGEIVTVVAEGQGDVPVHVPLQVVDPIGRQQRVETFEEILRHCRLGQVEDVLAPAGDLFVAGRGEDPVGMGAREVRVQADHFRLDPKAEAHAERLDVIDQRLQALRIDPWIDGPVAEPGAAVVARAEPAVVEHEALGAKVGRARGKVLQDLQVVVEIDRLPAVVVHRPRRGSRVARHHVLADV